jgi:hypothetical protein
MMSFTPTSTAAGITIPHDESTIAKTSEVNNRVKYFCIDCLLTSNHSM